jgi:hypothetical protein
MQILHRQSTQYQKENTLMQTALLGIDENTEVSSIEECKDGQDTVTISRNKTKPQMCVRDSSCSGEQEKWEGRNKSNAIRLLALTFAYAKSVGMNGSCPDHVRCQFLGEL